VTRDHGACYSLGMENSAATQPQPMITPEMPGVGGTIKQEPAHFVVEELPLYEPSGQGGHVYLRLRRADMNTRQVAEALAREFGLKPGEVGYAGLKDRQAVAEQTFSLALERLGEAEVLRRAGDLPGIEALWARRHGNKLKRGHLLGNRFRVLLTDVGPDAADRAGEIVAALGRRGLPNFYGAQRFGMRGDNAQEGRRALTGRGPRQKWLRTLVLNAFQAELFNRWLGLRIQRGDFARLVAGDIAKKTDTGGMFTVEDPEIEGPRLAAGEITYTGPVYGGKMRMAQGEAGELEELVLSREGVSLGQLKKAGLKGSRRPARLAPGPVELEQSDQGLWLGFALPKGAYATVLLAEIIKPQPAPTD